MILLLHPLGVIHFSGPAVIVREDSDRLIKTCSHKFPACGCEVDVQNGLDMVFVNHFGLIKLPHVKCIAVAILIALYINVISDIFTTTKFMGS